MRWQHGILIGLPIQPSNFHSNQQLLAKVHRINEKSISIAGYYLYPIRVSMNKAIEEVLYQLALDPGIKKLIIPYFDPLKSASRAGCMFHPSLNLFEKK